MIFADPIGSSSSVARYYESCVGFVAGAIRILYADVLFFIVKTCAFVEG